MLSKPPRIYPQPYHTSYQSHHVSRNSQEENHKQTREKNVVFSTKSDNYRTILRFLKSKEKSLRSADKNEVLEALRAIAAWMGKSANNVDAILDAMMILKTMMDMYDPDTYRQIIDFTVECLIHLCKTISFEEKIEALRKILSMFNERGEHFFQICKLFSHFAIHEIFQARCQELIELTSKKESARGMAKLFTYLRSFATSSKAPLLMDLDFLCMQKDLASCLTLELIKLALQGRAYEARSALLNLAKQKDHPLSSLLSALFSQGRFASVLLLGGSPFADLGAIAYLLCDEKVGEHALKYGVKMEGALLDTSSQLPKGDISGIIEHIKEKFANQTLLEQIVNAAITAVIRASKKTMADSLISRVKVKALTIIQLRLLEFSVLDAPPKEEIPILQDIEAPNIDLDALPPLLPSEHEESCETINWALIKDEADPSKRLLLLTEILTSFSSEKSEEEQKKIAIQVIEHLPFLKKRSILSNEVGEKIAYFSKAWISVWTHWKESPATDLLFAEWNFLQLVAFNTRSGKGGKSKKCPIVEQMELKEREILLNRLLIAFSRLTTAQELGAWYELLCQLYLSGLAAKHLICSKLTELCGSIHALLMSGKLSSGDLKKTSEALGALVSLIHQTAAVKKMVADDPSFLYLKTLWVKCDMMLNSLSPATQHYVDLFATPVFVKLPVHDRMRQLVIETSTSLLEIVFQNRLQRIDIDACRKALRSLYIHRAYPSALENKLQEVRSPENLALILKVTSFLLGDFGPEINENDGEKENIPLFNFAPSWELISNSLLEALERDVPFPHWELGLVEFIDALDFSSGAIKEEYVIELMSKTAKLFVNKHCSKPYEKNFHIALALIREGVMEIPLSIELLCTLYKTSKELELPIEIQAKILGRLSIMSLYWRDDYEKHVHPEFNSKQSVDLAMVGIDLLSIFGKCKPYALKTRTQLQKIALVEAFSRCLSSRFQREKADLRIKVDCWNKFSTLSSMKGFMPPKELMEKVHLLFEIDLLHSKRDNKETFNHICQTTKNWLVKGVAPQNAPILRKLHSILMKAICLEEEKKLPDRNRKATFQKFFSSHELEKLYLHDQEPLCSKLAELVEVFEEEAALTEILSLTWKTIEKWFEPDMRQHLVNNWCESAIEKGWESCHAAIKAFSKSQAVRFPIEDSKFT